MKLVSKLTAMLAAVLMMAACTEKNNDIPEETGTDAKRDIVYAVGGTEHRTELKSDAEWDALLEQFCEYAQQGQSVSFYNMSISNLSQGKGVGAKEVSTFSTTNRAEIKAWMKEMELQGKTVNVTFDKHSGTWNGTAYANAPHYEDNGTCYTGTLVMAPLPPVTDPYVPGSVVALRINDDTTMLLIKDGYLSEYVNDLVEGAHINDQVTLCGTIREANDLNNNAFLMLDITEHNEGALTGSWHYSCLAVTDLSASSDYLLNTDIYIPETEGQNIVFTFADDGTATRTVSGNNSGTTTGTWSLNNDGMLCCDLLPAGGGCWNINWLSHSTMVISRFGINTDDQNTFYQMQFDIPGNQPFKK